MTIRASSALKVAACSAGNIHAGKYITGLLCLCPVPPGLALYYAVIARGPSLAWLCRICLVLSLACGVAAVLLMWALYPIHYDYGQALKMTNSFFNAQRVGALPPDNNIPWRSNALLYETGEMLSKLA